MNKICRPIEINVTFWALDNILKFSFWLNFIYQVKMIANLQIQKEKFTNSF